MLAVLIGILFLASCHFSRSGPVANDPQCVGKEPGEPCEWVTLCQGTRHGGCVRTIEGVLVCIITSP
jgi:hypothetical protein